MEGAPEVSVKHGINDRVQRRVAVPDPEKDLEDHTRNAGVAEGRSKVQEKEWQPAENESCHDQTKNQCGPPLSGLRQFSLLSLRGEKVHALGASVGFVSIALMVVTLLFLLVLAVFGVGFGACRGCSMLKEMPTETAQESGSLFSCFALLYTSVEFRFHDFELLHGTVALSGGTCLRRGHGVENCWSRRSTG